MKKFALLTLLGLLALLPVTSPAASLAWDYPNPAGITHFTIYESPVIGPAVWTVFGITLDGQTLTFPLPLDGLPRLFYVTASSSLYESDPSNILEVLGRPTPPQDFRIFVQ